MQHEICNMRYVREKSSLRKKKRIFKPVTWADTGVTVATEGGQEESDEEKEPEGQVLLDTYPLIQCPNPQAGVEGLRIERRQQVRMPVQRLTGLLPWLLFNIILLFTGVSGSKPAVYSSAGELVSLPCNHHGSFNCSSITWYWESGRSPGFIKLVDDGVVNDEDQQIARRLRVGTNCSLHINNLTTADAGQYTCQLYQKGNDYVHVSGINLSILNISASSPVTELKIGSTVTLVCKLHSPEPCGKSVRVSWVSETGAPLPGNRYKLSESECSSNLTVTLERSDRNMKWRCQLTVEGKLKVSHSYTTIFPDGTYRELPARLVVFFLLLAIPPIIGTIFYIRRKKHAQTDQMPSGPSLDYGNIEMLD